MWGSGPIARVFLALKFFTHKSWMSFGFEVVKRRLYVPKITLWKSGRLCLVSQRKRRIWVGWSGQGILLSLSDSHYIAHVDDGVRYCFIKSKTWMMLLLLPSYSPQSAPIWPFIEVVEDKGRRSGLRERVGTKTWVAMLCFYRSALRALSLSLSLGPCWPHAAPGDGASCPSYRRATTLLCINHCIIMHPTICNIVNLLNWKSPSWCGTNTLSYHPISILNMT